MTEKDKSFKINWELLIAITALIFTAYTWWIGEKRNSENFEKEKNEKFKKEETFNTAKRIVVEKLKVYRNLIHSERKKEYYELYIELNNLIKDSSTLIDLDFKQLIFNHTTKLQLWLSRKNDNTKELNTEALKNEMYDLMNENKLLYSNLCSKYNIELDVHFFENIYLH